ncbi:MAG: ribokinase [Saccharofermentanales bacterium]
MKIINFGSLNIDYVYKVKEIVSPGETTAALSREVFSGGKGLNQSVALGRAGAAVSHAGLIGDETGDLLNVLEASGVETNLIRSCPTQTGHAVIQVDGNGQNSIIVLGGANRQITKDMLAEMFSGFDKSDMLLLQNETSCTREAIEQAFEKGMTICFNPSPFTEELKNYPIDKISWLILNSTEGTQMSGEQEPGEIVRSLSAKYPGLKIVLTLGSKGAICFDGESECFQSSFKVKAADTTGAGDTFTGYFLASVAAGKALPEALRTASAAAALAVTVKGAAASIPGLSDVEDFLYSQRDM